jgi:hypothetical protein
MVRTRDLMLGNYINASGIVCDVYGIKTDLEGVTEQQLYDTISFKPIECELPENLPKSIEGIKLTEEWLIKLGWTRHSNNFFHKWSFLIERIVSCEHFVHKVNNRYIRLEYVHNLQNLYYALMGSNLKLP